MPYARRFHVAVLLRDGSVLISGGGDTTGAFATNLLYTPTRDRFMRSRSAAR
jgi:hypothetical protein